MDMLGDLAIGAIALAPLVMGLVALAKNLGMPGDKAPYLTGILSVLGYFVANAAASNPAVMEIAEPVATAVMLFLVTSGTYQLQKTRSLKSGPKHRPRRRCANRPAGLTPDGARPPDAGLILTSIA